MVVSFVFPLACRLIVVDSLFRFDALVGCPLTIPQLQREEILASRKRRAVQLEKMLEDARERLRDHEKSIRLLTDEEKKALEKKIDLYQRKLDTLTGDLDERELERIIKREELRNERLRERRARREEL
jgi:phage-related minor tail protein